MAKHVAIVGAGFSGTMLAVQLLRRGARVSLIERAREPGRGLAYGAAGAMHVLNVRAGNMSAYPDDPSHFADWLERRSAGDATSFASRLLYGAYVSEQLGRARAEHSDRLTVVHGDAVDLVSDEDCVAVILADGRRIEADIAVLAIGNLPPPPGRGLDKLPPGLWIDDPWAADIAEGLAPDAAVLVVGTGLTMIDTVLLLEARGFAGPILAMSRRGLIPQAHAEGNYLEKRSHAPDVLGSRLVREVRARADRMGWRHAVDELRPFTQTMWRAAGPAWRGRFLRHLRPWWDIHRHRIAPEVAARIQAMIDRGQLRLAAGKLVKVAASKGVASVAWRPRGSETIEQAKFGRIINCTGPEADLARSPEPLLQALLERSAIQQGPNGLGLNIDEQTRIVDAAGSPDQRLFAVGPITRGALWEIIAVPDIRVQVVNLAARLA